MAKITTGKKLISMIKEYIENCKSPDAKKSVFANVAGFCSFAGISVNEFLKLKIEFPTEFENAGAFFEDAALNSNATATLVGMYLRQYGFWGAPIEDEVVCDHDMIADGI